MNTSKIRLFAATIFIALCFIVSGCAASDNPGIGLEDGMYTADFNTDSTMFHVNDTLDGKGLLTVENNKAVMHIVLTSKNIVNLYPGLSKDAENDTNGLYQPTVEEVTYDDGLTEEVNAFDIDVPYLDEEFDLALFGKKGKWYDHKVSVSNPVPYDVQEDTVSKDENFEDTAQETAAAENTTQQDAASADEFWVDVLLEGGSGRSSVESPAKIVCGQDGNMSAIIKWSSPYYDYMIVNDVKYLPVNTDGNSVFEIPVEAMGEPLSVIADTVAMSSPHEIEYTLTFSETNKD